MLVIGGILSWVFFGFLIYMAVGIFKKSDRKKYFKKGGKGALASFVALIVVSAFIPAEDIEGEKSTTVTQAETPPETDSRADVIVSDINLKTDLFDSRFNAAAKDAGQEFRSYANTAAYAKDGPYDIETAVVMFNDDLGLSVARRKTNQKIVSLILIYQSNGSTSNAVDAAIAIGCLMQAVDPSLTANERGEVLVHALQAVGSDETYDIIKERIKYSATHGVQTGLFFSVENAD